MLSFRTKLDLSYCVVLGLCLAVLFPISSRVVDKLVQRSLRDKTDHVVEVVRGASSLKELVSHLERQPPLLHRITVFRTGGELVYDSERARFGSMVPPQIYLARHPEVPEAFEKGYGYGQFFSETLGQPLVHMAVRIDNFWGDTLVVRTAFPLSEVESLTYWFKVGFFSISLGLLCIFMAIVVIVGYHISAPIRTIMATLRPYHEGQIDTFPRVKLRKGSRRDEIFRLAETLNDLSRRVQTYIGDLKFERSERETMLSYLSEGVLIVDRKLQVIYANAMAIRLQIGKQIQCVELQKLLFECLDEEKLVTKIVALSGGTVVVDATAVPRGQAKGVILILQRRVFRPQLPILEASSPVESHRVAELARNLRVEAVRSVGSKRVSATIRLLS